MRVLFVSSEIYPLAKTGGLADVSAGLPKALAALGADINLILPGYPHALAAALAGVVRKEFLLDGGSATTRLIEARMPDSGLPVWLVDCPSYFSRAGTPYLDEHGRDWPDNAQRFAHLTKVAASLALGRLVPGWQADVVHANDWHTGLLPLLIKREQAKPPATLFTIHNVAYQGLFPESVLPQLPIPHEIFTPEGVEFHGCVSFLKAGIRYSDHVTTVSPSYAREILTPEYGCGLDGLLRSDTERVSGILNGIDDAVWDPARDAYLPARYRVDDLAGKLICKMELQRELDLEINPDIPLVIWVSRITDQKMADVLADVMHAVMNRDIQVALLGHGDAGLETRLREAAGRFPDRLRVHIKYEESLAHRMYAGGDILLHPTRFEPCGLTPLYALRYGTLPVVRHVGGLLDTIVDATDRNISMRTANGFAFLPPTGDAMLDCLDRALRCYAERDVWHALQRRAMSRDFGWDTSARRYLELYYRLARPDLPSSHARPDRLPARSHELKERIRKPAA